MENLLSNAPKILLLLFLTITFLQSGIDKVLNWKGNLSWLTAHFAKSLFRGTAPVLLSIILVFEMFSGVFCGVGVFELVFDGKSSFGLYGGILSAISLLMLFTGQRVARDYDGAKTIVVYLIPTIFLIYLMQ
ncbi:DoxX family protein [Flagellimonas crocea]|uniref:DoxX family protein n=1 Tax=Flagellimonas crocea TaxID=3067311 RepID=UPI00296FA731|nr:DoxX family protein [Muricauda sp. DH64]